MWTSTGQRSSGDGWTIWRTTRAGSGRSRLILTYTARALDQLRHLTSPPSADDETTTLRRVRQSRRYQLWRVSHAFHPEVAVRLICWFPADTGTVVVALFSADKAKLGDVFYAVWPHAPTQ